MLFDINDFDETLPGPWEWDVKRLATSIVVAAQDRGFDDAVSRAAVASTVRRYRDTMRELAAQTTLDVWYARLDVHGVLDRWAGEVPKATVEAVRERARKARSKNSMKALARLTERVDGQIRIRNDPPVLERFEYLLPDEEVSAFFERARDWVEAYASSLAADRRHLLGGYRLVDFARKVVGVGSVGTRCFVALLVGRDESDPLFLQVKEAESSVLEPFCGACEYPNHGQRVVEGQRLMQAASDIFLGWERAVGFDDQPRDFYVRQLWDGKLSIDLATLPATMLGVYGQVCGWTLARAHARTGDRAAIAAYLGMSDAFDRAIVEFAHAYAAQNALDYEEALEATRTGDLVAF
jgi:uncharacterized protein (DUF2252 family)